MIQYSKKEPRFVVRTRFISQDVHFTTNNDESKKGRRKGASPPVNSVLRMDLVRSDLPPLFNQKSISMRTRIDNYAFSTPMAISAEQVIEHITFSDDPENLRKHLRALMDAYLLQSDDDLDYPRGVVYSSFLIIDEALRMIEENSNIISERRVS